MGGHDAVEYALRRLSLRRCTIKMFLKANEHSFNLLHPTQRNSRITQRMVGRAIRELEGEIHA